MGCEPIQRARKAKSTRRAFLKRYEGIELASIAEEFQKRNATNRKLFPGERLGIGHRVQELRGRG